MLSSIPVVSEEEMCQLSFTAVCIDFNGRDLFLVGVHHVFTFLTFLHLINHLSDCLQMSCIFNILHVANSMRQSVTRCLGTVIHSMGVSSLPMCCCLYQKANKTNKQKAIIINGSVRDLF